MRLRFKVLICLLATLVTLLAVMHYIAEATLMPRFSRIEQAEATDAAERLRAAVVNEIERVSVKSLDWSNWSDAVQFLQGQMPDFAARNIQESTIEEMQLSAILYTDREGTIRLLANSNAQTPFPSLSPDDAATITQSLNRHNDGASPIVGLMRFDGHALVFARHPVRDTAGTIEPVGTCLFGRFIGDEEVATMSDASGLPVSMTVLPPDSHADPIVVACRNSSSGISVSTRSQDDLAIDCLFDDFAGEPLLLAEGIMPRRLTAEGASAVKSLFVQLLIASSVLVLTSFGLFEVLVLSRVSKFSEQMIGIAQTQDLSRRIELDGSDEIAQMTKPANKLLASLSEAHAQLKHESALLETSEQRLTLALEAAGEGLWDWDLTNGSIYFSGTWARMLGYLEEDVPRTMRDFMAIVHPDDRGHAEALTRRHLAGEANEVCADLRLRTGTGTWKWVLVKGRIVTSDVGGRGTRMIGTHQDIDERRQAELELRQSRERLAELTREAQQASRTKSEFLANMSHEIRTPMSAIIGYSDLLLDESVPASQRNECLHTIRRNGQHLLALINDILDLSKVEAGKMTVERIACDPVQILADVESLMRVRATEKSLSFVTGYDGRIPRRIRTDPMRLRQVLLNLVSNAIKFTQSGEVSVRMKMVDGPQGAPPMLRFVVADTGIGMTPEQLQSIFEPFHQADTSTTRKFGGTGLGLAISKRLVEVLGGSINVASTLGAGTQVGLTIGVGADAAFEPAPESPEANVTPVPTTTNLNTALTGMRVLLAEDGVDNQRLISFYLTRSGATVELAENGQVAIDRIDSATLANRPFDVVLMDMQMPTLDGYAAATRLRQMGFTTPIVALTAHAMAGDRTKCIDAGCTEYLTKPVDRTRLIETLVSLCPRSSRAAAGALHSTLQVSDPGLSELVKEYVEELPRQTASIVSLWEQQNFHDLRRLVHQIKGAGGGYGFPAISDAAADAEQSLRMTHDLQSIRIKVDGLIDLLRSVQGYDRSLEICDAAASLAH